MRFAPHCAAEDELQAYADGALSDGRRQHVEAYLGAMPEEQKRVDSYRRVNVELHRLYDRPEFESVPRSYAFLAGRLAEAVRRQRLVHRLVAGSAVVLVAGLTTVSFWRSSAVDLGPVHPLATFAKRGTTSNFVLVDQPAIRPADPKLTVAAKPPVLSRQLSTFSGPQWAPDLAHLGFKHTGERIIATASGPAIELRYVGPDDRRMVLTVKPAHTIHHMAFTLLEDEEASLVSWQHGVLTYSLVANIDRPKLLEAARAISGAFPPASLDNGLATETKHPAVPAARPVKSSPTAPNSAQDENAKSARISGSNDGARPTDAPFSGVALTPTIAPAADVRKVGLDPQN